MRTEDLDFPLPEELIARHPPQRRGDARLLVARGAGAPPEHRRFAELPELLAPGDLLVLNDTRVLPARLELRKESGGRVEGLFLDEAADGSARLMLSGGRLRPGVALLPEPPRVEAACGDEPARLRLVARLGRGVWRVERDGDEPWTDLLARVGRTPLPPYVRRLRAEAGEPDEDAADRDRYQTVWARAGGSVAAPTASLHFTDALLEALDAHGVQRAPLTLHVERGTFLPVETERLEDHAMHAERFVVPPATEDALRAARAEGRRVIAAGTTVCRALEAWARGERGSTRLLIAPGFDFRAVDALLTNFHVPRSTLLALVAAFAERLGAADGLARVKAVYAEAVAERYRFFSYGDASLWLPADAR